MKVTSNAFKENRASTKKYESRLKTLQSQAKKVSKAVTSTEKTQKKMFGK